MSTTRDLLEAVTTIITAAYPGRFTYSGDGVNDNSGATTPVTLQFQPSDPDRCLSLYAVVISDEPNEPRGTLYVQIKARARRGIPLDVDDDLDDVFSVFHGVTGLDYGAWGIVQALRHNSVPLGIDDLNRRERADHYEVTVDYPPTIVRPDGGAW